MIGLEKVCLRIGSFRLEDVSFRIPSGAYAVLMGETGCGKTSIVEAICGLRRIISGRISIDRSDMTRERPADRGIGYVPQDGALFSTLTVREHLEFALRVRRWSRGAIERRVDELACKLDLEKVLGRKPPGLSGGERQRVALGRALSFNPAALCLDEPLSALDEASQDRMCALLRSVHAAGNLTVLHITHSRLEAGRLGSLRLKLERGAVSPSLPADS